MVQSCGIKLLSTDKHIFRVAVGKYIAGIHIIIKRNRGADVDANAHIFPTAWIHSISEHFSSSLYVISMTLTE